MPTPSRIDQVAGELRAASAAAQEVCGRVGTGRLLERPGAEKWSVAECITHLRISSEINFPLWESAFQTARTAGLSGREPYRADFLGRFLAWSLEPPPRFKIRTPTRFEPVDTGPAEQVLPAFLASQDRVLAAMESAKDLALDKIKIVSPVNARLRYNIWSSLLITTAHQRRHLWQADQAGKAIRDRA